MEKSNQKQPNILVIWGDDIGISNLSCYSHGLMGYRTPNIDRLAKEDYPVISNTDLAFERTMLAHERTLMAWIRTAISMISFGFTIYKFFEELSKTPEGEHRLLTPRIVGMIMISFGFLSLLLGQVQHQIAVKRIKQNCPGTQRSLSSVMSVLVLMFGLVLFLGALFRQ